MRSISLKSKVIVAGVAAATLGASGAAYAYWSTTGSGTGSATTGTSSNYTIVNAATTGDPLSPDGPTQTATFNVHNPGSGVQKMNAVVAKIANANGTPWTAVSGCSASDYSVGGEAVGVAHTITNVESLAPGADSAQLSVTIKMINNPSADQEACKGVTVPLYYSVS